MARWRSPELEAIVGGPLDESGLTEAALDQMIDEGAREGEQLDFKKPGAYERRSGPKKDWSAEQEFAKDVAAFANHRGGLILIGVDERDHVAAKPVPIVDTTAEAQERRLRQALTNYQAPIAHTSFVAIPATAGGFYIAVEVPPSPRAPHAVLGSPGHSRRPLHYPVRHGADTAWLTESEVATRYRQRLEATTEQAHRVDSVVREGRAMLRRTADMWLHVAVVPDMPAPGSVTSDWVADSEKWLRENRLNSPCGQGLLAASRPLPAPGRVTFTELPSSQDDEPDPCVDYVELYVDGAAFAATAIVVRTADEPASPVIGQRTLVDSMIMLVDLALRWAASTAGAWGTATVVAGIDNPTVEITSSRALELGGPSRSTGKVRRVPGTRKVFAAPSAKTTADLAAVDTVQQRLVVAYATTAGLLQWFGVAEPNALDRSGRIVAARWNEFAGEAKRWADSHEVECG